MGVGSSLDDTLTLNDRKASPEADPKGKKSLKNKTKKNVRIMNQSFDGVRSVLV